ncbi:tape measure protein [Pseudomonas putida]|uniref:tape measure protein n=1 Tax=Pseudomonas putida TaxID=303 RepID=UPI00236345B2|nr:tape measure protein [Pseudomonas putida]MDD2027103.1 tape measure protein [Pseudomonas putida]HDS1765636.1 tape measure protein [Pseudomonas putida]
MAQESRLSIVIDSRNARQQIDQLRTSLNSLGDAGGEATVNVRGLGTAARAAGSALAALGVGAVAREVLRMTDAFKNMQGSLALVSTSTANASESFQKLLAMANNTGSSLESTVSLYTRLANATRGAGYTQEQMLNVTDALNKAFVISGATMQEASNAAIQLSQGLASGTLRGEELNSVMEQGPRITRALADYLGVTNGQIRQLAADGKITGDVVTNALLKSLTSLNAELAKMPRTFEQASQALKNNFLAAVGQINVDPVVSSVDALAASLAQPDVVMGIQRIANGLGSLVAVGGDGLKTVVENTDALIAVAGAYATKVGVGLVSSLALSAKARLADTAAANQQLVAARQGELAAASEAVAIHSVTVATAEASLARAIYARSEAMAATQTELSSVKQLKAVSAQLAADRQLEIQRLQAQITNAGLTASHTRLAEIRTAEAAIANQLAAAEGRLAASRQAELATGAVVGQQTVALNAVRTDGVAILGAQTAAQNALNAAEQRGIAARTAGSAALSAFGGPLGLITLGLSVAAGAAIYFASSTDTATEALIDQNLTLDDSIAKFRELSAEQKRFQSSKWMDAQRDAARDASSALNDYFTRAFDGLNSLGASGVESAETFKSMFAEVRNGQRSLDSLTGWLTSNTQISSVYRDELVKLGAEYSASSQKADDYARLLDRSKTATDGAASSATSLASAQKASAAAVGGGAQAWDKYISQLTQARDLVGANTAQEAAYTAAKAGFNSQQVEYARLIGQQTDLLKKYEEAVKDGKKEDQERLRVQLTASIAASEAIKTQMESQGRSMKTMAENAESSAKRQVDAIQTVIDQTVRYAKGLSLVEKYEPKQNLQGASLLTFGQQQPTSQPKSSPKTKTVAEMVQEVLDQIDGNTTAKPGNTGSPQGQKGLSSKLNEAQTAFDNLYKAAQPAKFALQEYVERQSQLELLLSKGKITQQQYNEALAQSSLKYAEAVRGQDEHLARLKQINDQYVKGQSLAELYAQKAAATGIQGPAGNIARSGIDSAIKGQIFNGKPNSSVISAEVGGPSSELTRMAEENAQLQAWYDQRIAMYQQYRQLEVENAAQYDEAIRQLEQQRAEDTVRNDQAMSMARISMAQEMFGDLTSLVGTFAGEQSSAYKAMFAVSKAVAIAQALINAPKTASDAYAAMAGIPIVGPALGIAAAGAALTAQMAQVASIRSISLPGFATGGYVSGAGTGTSDSIMARLSDGEFVVNAAATKRNRALLEAINSNERVSVASGGGSSVVATGGQMQIAPAQQNVVIHNYSTSQVQTRQSANGDLEVIIQAVEDHLSNQIATGYGQFVDAGEGAYGWKRQGA